MPAIPVGSAEFTLLFSVAGNARTISWAHGFDHDDLITPSGPQDLCDEIYTQWTATSNLYSAAFMSTGWSITGCVVTYMTDTGPIVAQHLQTINGTATEPSVPCNSAILMAKNTASGGRRNRGRAYLPPTYPGEDLVTSSGQIDAAQVEGLQDTVQLAFDYFDTAGYTMLLFHQTSPFTPTPVTSWTVKGLLATQRRRMRG